MYHFILNPTASSGGGVVAWEEIRPDLMKLGVDYELHMFHTMEQLKTCVKNLSKPSFECLNHIVVLGGDGTLNAVVNAIDDFDAVKLSVLRVGSGNDFARNVGVKKDINDALLHLLYSPERTKLDYGVATYVAEDGAKHKRRFVISSGIGYDADICEEAGRSRLKKVLNKVRLGKLVYLMVGLKQVFKRQCCRARLYMDGERVRLKDMFFAVAMIHPKEGGGVPFCPKADPSDGTLDVCVVKKASLAKLNLEIALVYRKKHTLFSNIKVFRCKQMKAVLDKPRWIHLDGETPVKVKKVYYSIEHESGITFVK